MIRMSEQSAVASGLVDAELIPTAIDMPLFNMTALLSDPRFVYTSNVLVSHTSAVVFKEVAPKSPFALLDPFAPSLWIAIIVALSIYALLLLLMSGALFLKATWQPGKMSNSVGGASYHVMAACFGGEDYEWISGPMRLLRLSLLGMVLVSGSTYTANLAAFFNKPNIKVRTTPSPPRLSLAISPL